LVLSEQRSCYHTRRGSAESIFEELTLAVEDNTNSVAFLLRRVDKIEDRARLTDDHLYDHLYRTVDALSRRIVELENLHLPPDWSSHDVSKHINLTLNSRPFCLKVYPQDRSSDYNSPGLVIAGFTKDCSSVRRLKQEGLKINSRLVRINGVDVEKKRHREILNLLGKAKLPVDVTFRLPPEPHYTSTLTRESTPKRPFLSHLDVLHLIDSHSKDRSNLLSERIKSLETQAGPAPSAPPMPAHKPDKGKRDCTGSDTKGCSDPNQGHSRRLASFSDPVPDLSIFVVLLPLLFVVFLLYRRFQPAAAKWIRSLTSKKSEWILPRYEQDLDEMEIELY